MKIVIKELKENHNVSKESDSKVFLKFVWIFAIIIIWLFFSLLVFAGFLTKFVSLEDEKKYFSWLSGLEIKIKKESTKKLKEFLGTDFGYEVVVIEMNEANAFALPWWTIAITDTMLEDMKYENSLLFIIWHEIWHIENRDVFKAIVSRVPIQILLSIIWVWWDIDIWFIFSSTNQIHSKWVETDADVKWLEFLNKSKWSVECAIDYFKKDLDLTENIMSFLSDHPMTWSRIEKIEKIIKENWYKENSECKLLDLKIWN